VSSSGDDGSEMPRPGPLDDDAIDALLAGTARGDAGEGLASFIEDLRALVGAVPTPSPVLAAAMAAGAIVTLQPTVAHSSPVTSWRMLPTRIRGFLAGLGVAGKLALGAGVAAAAITGAAAAGVLPGPVQHAVSETIGRVSPFSFPDPDHHHGAGHGSLAGGATTTTVVDVTTTTAPGERSHDGNGAVVTPTTGGAHDGVGAGETTTTIGHDGNGSNAGTGGGTGAGTGGGTGAGTGGGGTGGGPGAGTGETPTTVPNGGGNGTTSTTVGVGGDNKFLSIQCTRSADTVRIACSWSASSSPDHAHYVLFRTGDGNGRVVLETENALSFTDVSVVPGTAYGYRVSSLRADGSVDSHSPLFRIDCCGQVTTTTTAHQNATTATTVRGGHGANATTKP
jgi:hypothetical protein